MVFSCNRAIHFVKARFLLFRCRHGIILFKYVEIYYTGEVDIRLPAGKRLLTVGRDDTI